MNVRALSIVFLIVILFLISVISSFNTNVSNREIDNGIYLTNHTILYENTTSKEQVDIIYPLLGDIEETLTFITGRLNDKIINKDESNNKYTTENGFIHVHEINNTYWIEYSGIVNSINSEQFDNAILQILKSIDSDYNVIKVNKSTTYSIDNYFHLSINSLYIENSFIGYSISNTKDGIITSNGYYDHEIFSLHIYPIYDFSVDNILFYNVKQLSHDICNILDNTNNCTFINCSGIFKYKNNLTWKLFFKINDDIITVYIDLYDNNILSIHSINLL